MTEHTLIAGPSTPVALEPLLNRHLIGGAWTDSADGETFDRLSPSHGALVSRSARGGPAETEAAIAAARKAFDAGDWRFLPGKQRAALLLRVADLIDRNRERIARIEVLESGKPISQALGEIEGAADLWRYAAALARTVHGDSHNSLGPDMLGVVLKEPIGVVGIITPWNFPFLIVCQKLPFALAAGCTAVVKPSELTPSTTVILGELLMEAGLPPGVLNIVLGHGDPVGATLSSHPGVDMVSFTGSTRAGIAITKAAADTLKKVALELGGKGANVVFADADDKAVTRGTRHVFYNSGQSCNAPTRMLVERSFYEQAIETAKRVAEETTVGSAHEPGKHIGPVVSKQQWDKIQGLIQTGIDEGARLVAGGPGLPEGVDRGYFVRPTVFADVTPDMTIFRQEIFGPVLSITPFDTEEEAVELANDTIYGLTNYVQTQDGARRNRLARQLKAGMIEMNGVSRGRGSAFGGVKASGRAREGGVWGLEEFMDSKQISGWDKDA